MKAIILSAGRGKRMRSLTEHSPKPLLLVNKKPLLQYHIEALATAGIKEIVVNHALMGEMIEDYFGDGDNFNVNIKYSAEGNAPLETGGGIRHALPLLGEEPFIVVNGDIWTDYDFSSLPEEPEGQAHLVLVSNPSHHLDGDFCLEGDCVRENGEDKYTYSGIGVYRPSLFADIEMTSFPLAPLIRGAIRAELVSGELYHGEWLDIGTPERLEMANNKVIKEK
jgi:N-acetyl-alpha-D-muramate 1-phosphate uridylyltransferase